GKRKPSPKPSSSESSCARATSALMSEAASERASARRHFETCMPYLENSSPAQMLRSRARRDRSYPGDEAALVALFACAAASATTFVIDKCSCFVPIEKPIGENTSAGGVGASCVRGVMCRGRHVD